jgi:hypothetical protein
VNVKKKFKPKSGIVSPANLLKGNMQYAEEQERLKLLEEFYNDPVEFIADYYTDAQSLKIRKELLEEWVDPWNEERCC